MPARDHSFLPSYLMSQTHALLSIVCTPLPSCLGLPRKLIRMDLQNKKINSPTVLLTAKHFLVFAKISKCHLWHDIRKAARTHIGPIESLLTDLPDLTKTGFKNEQFLWDQEIPLVLKWVHNNLLSYSSLSFFFYMRMMFVFLQVVIVFVHLCFSTVFKVHGAGCLQ